MSDVHPGWRHHDLDQGFRDAFALLTATDAADDEARRLIWQSMCRTCVTEALLALVLSAIDEREMTVAEFTQGAMMELEL